VDSIGALRIFVHAAEARSFTAAGGRLGISSSAIGKAIARLEAELGARLFHRSTRSITLTPEGTQFLERCRRILGELEAAEQDLAHTRQVPRGKLRVSLPMAGMLLMPALNAFMRKYPEVCLDLEFTDRLVEVIDEGFDAVIRAGGVRDSRLVSRSLGEFRLKLVAAPAYLARRGTPQEPEDLMAHACLHHRFANSGKFERWPLRRRGKDIDLSPPSAAIVNTIEPLIAMAEHGLGIACLPDFAIREQLADGTLQSVLDAHVEHTGLFHLLRPSQRSVPPKLRVFVDFMVENLFSDTLTDRPHRSDSLRR
jgi:DNA-binding transcriptional LysR family regulator